MQAHHIICSFPHLVISSSSHWFISSSQASAHHAHTFITLFITQQSATISFQHTHQHSSGINLLAFRSIISIQQDGSFQQSSHSFHNTHTGHTIFHQSSVVRVSIHFSHLYFSLFISHHVATSIHQRFSVSCVMLLFWSSISHQMMAVVVTKRRVVKEDGDSDCVDLAIL